MEEKVWAQICRKADTSVKDLTPNARGFLRRRTKHWLGARKVTSDDVDQAALDLKKRYPAAISGVPSPCPAHMMPKLSQARSMSSTSELSSGGPRAHKFQSLPPRAATPSANSTMAPDNAVPTRPAVVQRMLSMAANKKWQESVEQQVMEYEAEERSKLEKRRELKKQIQRDIVEAESYRLRAKEMSKKEREENRKVVLNVMKDVEAEEKLKIVSRREKEIRERADMEEQRLDKMRRDELRKEHAKEENVRIRQKIKADIQEYEVEQTRHKQEVKGALLEFLAHSEKITKERMAAKAQELAEQRSRDKNNANQPNATDANAALTEKQYRNQMDQVKKRQQLQSAVGQIFLQQEEQNAHQRQVVERRTVTAMDFRNQQLEERNRVDQQKKEEMRTKLVLSLDEEIRIRDDRIREAESGKSVLRKRVDDDTLRFQEERAAELADERQKQLKLCKELDHQVKERFQHKLKPGKIKITEKDEVTTG